MSNVVLESEIVDANTSDDLSWCFVYKIITIINHKVHHAAFRQIASIIYSHLQSRNLNSKIKRIDNMTDRVETA